LGAPRDLLRLRKLRETEEQQKKSVLASAFEELHRLESELEFAKSHARRGRALLISSALSGDRADRVAGMEEVAATGRLIDFLTVQLQVAADNVGTLLAEFLAKRIQRRQVQTLLESALTQSIAEERRKSQMLLDDWHLSRHTVDASESTE
jgi:flagellar export protein FliJ